MPFCSCGEILRPHMPSCLACKAPNPSYAAGVSAAAGDRSFEFISGAFADNSGTMGVLAATAGLSEADFFAHDTIYRCGKCGREIGSEAAVIDKDIPYHLACHETESMCASCGNRIIVGAAVNTGGKTYHQDCFVCQECSIVLKSDYKVIGERHYCDRCAVSVPKVVKTTTTTPLIDSRPGRAAVDNSPHCAVCGAVIEAETPVIFNGDMLHRDCFCCVVCGNVIEDDYAQRNGEAAHKTCVGPLCDACKQPITGTFVTENGKKMHKACIKCVKCGGSLDGGYVPSDDGKLCPACGTGRTTTRTVTTGVTGRGVRVNPATGRRYVS